MPDHTDISFYVTGGTLRHDAACYVERQADKDLLDGLRKGEFCYVLTSRQMGKSSLMVRTANKLREQGIQVAVLDLTAIGQNLTPEQWYDGLVSRMGRQLRLEDELEDFWEANRQLGPCQRFFTAIREVALAKCSVSSNQSSVISEQSSVKQSGGAAPLNTDNWKLITPRLVVFVDELDVVRSLPFSTDEFFAAIRECYTRRTEDAEFNRLTFCLLGVATPSDLIRDTRLTPFNIGTRIVLNDFTPEEAAPLAGGLNVQHSTFPPSLGAAARPRRNEVQAGNVQGSTTARASLDRILHWTNGHPYLTQRLCQALAARSSRRPPEGRVPRGPDQGSAGEDQGLAELVPPQEEVDALCAELFFTARAREQDDNLLFVRERLLRAEADRASLLYLYGQVLGRKRVPDDETNPLVSVLRLSGLTREVQGLLHVRNRIYRKVFALEWIQTNMPDAEVRRQKAAFRRGLVGASTVAIILITVVAGLALVAIKQRNRARQEELGKSRLLYAAAMNLVQQAWEAGNARRAVELLDSHRPKPGQEDLRGFEWRYLWKLCQGDSFCTLRPHATNSTDSLVFSPDGKTLAVGGAHAVELWDVA